MLIAAFYLYAFAIPFSAAGQHIVSGIASACLLVFLTLNFKFQNVKLAWKKVGVHFVLLAVLQLLFAFANFTNPHGNNHPLHFMGGFATLWVVPLLLTMAAQNVPSEMVKKHALVALGCAVLFMGTVAISQIICPWRLVGLHIEEDIPRARAFFSHPLSFAYVCGILFIFFFCMMLKKRKQKWFFLSALSMAIGLYASNSKMMQAVVICSSVFMVFRMVPLKNEKLIGVLTVVAVALLFIVPNSFSAKFHDILFNNPDLQSHYTDDRLAFWRVHWEMLMERPFFGHGSNLDSEYRSPFYQRLGLGFMTKQYEAHNQFLQMAVEVGFLGLGVFLVWCAFWLRYFYVRRSAISSGFIASFLVLLIAGFTQNAFQDSVVRYSFTVLLIFCVQINQNISLKSK